MKHMKCLVRFSKTEIQNYKQLRSFKAFVEEAGDAFIFYEDLTERENCITEKYKNENVGLV